MFVFERGVTFRPFVVLFVVLVFAMPLSGATRTWSGAVDGSWSNAANWDALPAAGDDLVFPSGPANVATNNDFAAGTAFNSITVSGSGYTLAGNAIQLTAGCTFTSGATSMSLPVTLLASQSWTGSGGGFAHSGTIDLNGFELTFDISPTASTVSGVISGSGSIVKMGPGELHLGAANAYSGTTTINAGYLRTTNAASLGVGDGTPANGTIIQSAGSLNNATALGNEWISASGAGMSNDALRNGCTNATFNGPVVFGANLQMEACGGGSMTFNGVVSGSPLIVTLDGNGSVVFNNGGNTFATFLNMAPGNPLVVNAGANDAIPAGTIPLISSGTTLNLNGFNDTMAGISGNGDLNLGGGTLTLDSATSLAFSGVISGAGNVIVAPSLTMEFGGTNTTTAPLTNNGIVKLRGATWPASVTTNPGAALILERTSSSGPLLSAAGSTLETLIDDSTPNQFGQVQVTGAVNIAGVAFTATPSMPFNPGTTFVIIANDGVDPIAGTFTGLTEGATFTTGFQPYRITYAGGDGNDLAVTALGTTATSVASSVNPSTFGQSVTFTATVLPEVPGPTPTGTVELFDGATSLGTAALDGSGQATRTTSSLTQGTHTITAVYNGDANYAGSTSAPLTQNVDAAADIPAVPTLDPRALLALLVGIALVGVVMMRR